MKTTYFFLFLALCAAKSAHAQSDTDDLLGAPNAKSFIQLWPDFEKDKIYYYLDADVSRKHYKSLSSCPTVGVPRRSREIALTIRFFNPLQYSIRTTDTLLEDPSYANISKFASSLTDFLKLLPSVADVKKNNNSPTQATSNDPVSTAKNSGVLSRYKLEPAGEFTPMSASVVNASEKVSVPIPMTDQTASLTILTLPDGTTATVPKAINDIIRYVNDLGYDDLAEWKYLYLSGRLGCLDTKTDVMNNLALLDDRYYNGNFRITVIKALDKLSKPDNVKAFKIENVSFKKTIDSLKGVNSTNQQILKSFDNAISGDIYKLLLNRTTSTALTSALDAGKAKEQLELCTAFATYSQIVFKRMVRACLDGQRKRDQILDLADQLTNEITNTQSTVDETFGDDDGGYHAQNAIILGRYTIADDKMHDVGILVRRRLFDFNTDPPMLSAMSEKLYGHIKIRSSQTLIPEFSVGLYFTNFFYPVYSTKTLTAKQADDLNTNQPKPTSTTYSVGQTIVDEVVNQPVPVVAAAMLNLTLNAFNGLVHPFGQIGVGTGKTLPTFLLGGGVRLRGPLPIMISAGAIWNWKKQFTDLRVNQVIDGQAQLERDLQTVFDPKPRFYIGIQMHL
jgi:hypothetical protein